MPEVDDLWRRLIVIHQHTKDLIIKSEEFGQEIGSHGNEFRGYFHPFKEQRESLEHVIRSQAARLRIEGSADSVFTNLDKAIGHSFRAFFDQADYMSIVIRKKISSSLSSYSNAAICEVLPDYYTKIRPLLEKINEEIASIRERKDIASAQIVDLVCLYKEKIDELWSYYKSIVPKIGSLEEYKRKEGKEKLEKFMNQEASEKRSVSWQFIIGIGVAIFSFLLGYFFSRN